MGKFSDLAYQLKKNGPPMKDDALPPMGEETGDECTCPKCKYSGPEEEFKAAPSMPASKTPPMPGGMGGMGGM